MGITLQLTDGTTSVDLAYDAQAQTVYRNTYQTELSNLQPQESWHRPHGAPRELTESVDDLLQVFLNLVIVDNTGIDEVLDAIVDVRRLINQARRYSLHGDVDRVDLKIQRDGATNATMWPVVNGFVDDSRAHYEAVAQESDLAFDVTVALSVGPYGEAETAITLDNPLSSSPHFVEDSDDDGLADGWGTIGTPSDTSLSTFALIGGTSQSVTVPSSGSVGIQSDAVSAASGTDAVAYVWVHASSAGNDQITIRLSDGSGNIIDSAFFDPADPSGFDKLVTLPGGTWRRYVVSGKNSTAADFRLLVFRRSTDASQETQYFVDGAYLQGNTTTVPDVWMSSRTIRNRYDPTDANPERINYIDVWGVPGDAPALVDIELDWSAITGTGKGLLYASRFADGRVLAADVITWVGSDEVSAGTTANASFTTGSGTSEDHFHRLTQDGTANEGQGRLGVTFTGATARALLTHPQRMFWLVRTSDLATRYKVLSTTPAGLFSTDGVGVQTVDQWEIIDMGLFNLQGIAPLDPPDTSNPSFTLTIEIDGLPASGSDTADLDALIFMPTVDEFMAVEFLPSASTSNELHIRGQDRDVVVDTRGIITDGVLGSLWELEPGNKMNRLIFALADRNDSEYAITDAARVTLTIIPRTRHLLGTT